MRLAILILLCGLLAPVRAQDILPPSGARVVANGPKGVLLEWPGSAEEHFFVQVYTEGFPRFDEEVKGNTLSLPLDPGLSYWWRVTRKKGHAFEEVVPNRLFEVVRESEFVVTGKDGLRGQPGQSPPKVAVTLTPVGGYTKVFISVAPSNRIFYLAPGAGPFLVSARGGRGGDGYPGTTGTWYYYDPEVDPLFEPGSDGGDGGNGGAGGEISVISNGLKVLDYLVLDVEGGDGGAGGAGTSESKPGESGRPGRSGCVSIRERAK